MTMNIYLQALLEAAKDKEKEAEDTTDNAEEETDDANLDGDNDDSAAEDENSTEDENPEEDENNEEDSSEEDKSEESESSEDDFSLDSDNTEDDDPIPDGLTDPDDDGSGDMEDDNVEKNVHINILQLSKLDRTLAKRKCFSDFQELRTTITTFRNIISTNEATIDPDIREIAYSRLDKLYTQVTDYLTFKFSFINYEENLQNYLLFMKSMDSIVHFVQGDEESSKKSKKAANKSLKDEQ